MPNIASSDAGDVQQTLRGNREAFGRLYDKHAASVRAVVVAVSRDFNSVDDLVQETFTRAFSRLTTLNNPKDFRNWVLGIARFVAKERLRDLSRKHIPMELVRTPDVSVNVADVVDEEELQHILTLIGTLPERDRLAIHAYFFSEQNAAEAARVLGISRSGFYATLERGLARLRKELGKQPNTKRETKQ